MGERRTVEQWLLYFAAECHRRKWAYSGAYPDDDRDATFDVLHHLGNELKAAYETERAAHRDKAPRVMRRTVLAAIRAHIAANPRNNGGWLDPDDIRRILDGDGDA